MSASCDPCFPHGPDERCTCDGCSDCDGYVLGCTCDIDWGCEHIRDGGCEQPCTHAKVSK